MTKFTLPAEAKPFLDSVLALEYPGFDHNHSYWRNLLMTTATVLSDSKLPMGPSQKQIIMLGAVISVQEAIAGKYSLFSPKGSIFNGGSGLYKGLKALPLVASLVDAEDKVEAHDFALRAFQDWFSENKESLKPQRRRENLFFGDSTDYASVESDLCKLIFSKEVKTAAFGKHSFPTEPSALVTAINGIEYSGRWGSLITRLKNLALSVPSQKISAEAKHQILLGAIVFTMTQISGATPSLTASSSSRLFNALKAIPLCKEVGEQEKSVDIIHTCLNRFYTWYVDQAFYGKFVDVAKTHEIPAAYFDKNSAAIKTVEALLATQTADLVVKSIGADAFAAVDGHVSHELAAGYDGDAVEIDASLLASRKEQHGHSASSVLTAAVSGLASYLPVSFFSGGKADAPSTTVSASVSKRHVPAAVTDGSDSANPSDSKPAF